MARRWKPHVNKQLLGLREIGLELFKKYFREVEISARDTAKKMEVPYPGIPDELVEQLAGIAAKKAARVWRKRMKVAKKAERRRHRLARRINFGLVSGNRKKGTHSGG